jgi:Fe-S-cluster containining protein
MVQTNTLDKVVGYMAMVCAEPFTFDGESYVPKRLRVSPDLVRGYTCPVNCGACCMKFSLDYIPAERVPDQLQLRVRTVEANGKLKAVFSDLQTSNNDRSCKHLDKRDGRCNIHGDHPFSCDFELLRFHTYTDDENANQFSTRLFGRKWAMLRIDGDRGALCEITEIDESTVKDTVRKLRRLATWCEYFGVVHKVHDIIEWAQDPEARLEPLFI